MLLLPPSTDIVPQNANEKAAAALSDLDLVGSIERKEDKLLEEMVHRLRLLEFTKDSHALGVVMYPKEELMKA
jgi:hypothetical protein